MVLLQMNQASICNTGRSQGESPESFDTGQLAEAGIGNFGAAEVNPFQILQALELPHVTDGRPLWPHNVHFDGTIQDVCEPWSKQLLEPIRTDLSNVNDYSQTRFLKICYDLLLQAPASVETRQRCHA